MKLSPIIFVLFFTVTPISAHFFPNITSIPISLIPNTTLWDGFNQFLGSHKGQKVNGLAKLKNYFQRFGYISSSSSANFTDDFDEILESAVKMYQINFNLNSTGELDVQTLKHVVLPRCGNPDVINGTSTMNSGKPKTNYTIHTLAHYSFFPNKPSWPASKTELTYSFSPDNQLPENVKSLFGRAFERWSEVTPLTFAETSSFRRADIKIGFFSGNHGDGEAFDGILGTLAHAFSPPSGLFHLDGDENWVMDGDFINASPLSAVDLESVAVHEIGHILGLGHSSDEAAIMYPTISSGMRKVELANDDILGIQELYGASTNFNESDPVLTPRNERDTNGAHYFFCSFWRHGIILAMGLFLFL